MPLSRGATPTAMAFQVVAALETYEQDLDHFVSAPLEPGFLSVVGNALERVKTLVDVQGELGVPLLELMISHTQLTQAYGDIQSARYGASELTQLYKQHCERVESMRRKCLQMVQSH